MDKFDRFIAAAAGGFLLPTFEFMYGGGRIASLTMILLVLLIALDWMSGWSASRKDGSYASQYGIDGVVRTAIMLLLPTVGHLIDQIAGLPSVFFGLMVFGLAYHTLKSFVANSVRAGWGDRLPLWVLDRLMDWAKSEIDAKLARATQRKADRSVDQ